MLRFGETTLAPRHDTLENWNKYNPVLAKHEVAVARGNADNYIRIGDGISRWKELPFLSVYQVVEHFLFNNE